MSTSSSGEVEATRSREHNEVGRDASLPLLVSVSSSLHSPSALVHLRYMSLYTTTTATYELLKYSRAYGQSNNPASSQAELEWQHFANPVIRLMLDTKKSPEGRLESYRLRIVWTFSNGVNSMDVDERELVFVSTKFSAYSLIYAQPRSCRRIWTWFCTRPCSRFKHLKACPSRRSTRELSSV